MKANPKRDGVMAGELGWEKILSHRPAKRQGGGRELNPPATPPCASVEETHTSNRPTQQWRRQLAHN